MSVVLTIAGILCALYGILVMSVRSGTWFFAFWFVLAAVLVGAGWLVGSQAWASLNVVAKRVVEGFAVLLLAGFVATQVCIARDFNDAGEPDLDCIMVLGAQVRDDGPSVVLRYRLDAAADYLMANPRTRCIVSGGQGPNEPAAEAQVMAEYLQERGIDGSRIAIEDQSENTFENISNCMALLEAPESRVGIVTNDFHLFRALAIARKAGLEDPVGIAAPSTALFLPNNCARESLGIAKDFLTRNI